MNADEGWDEMTCVVADAFWLEPESADEALQRLTTRGYRIVKIGAGEETER